MNRYAEMQRKQQERMNALPIKYAFSKKQFEEMMHEWGLTTEDTDKIYRLGYTGGYYLKTDSELIKNTLLSFEEEQDDAVAADETGEGFVYEMFLYELENHEYCITMDPEDALEACGYTMEQVLASPKLKRGFAKGEREAARQH